MRHRVKKSFFNRGTKHRQAMLRNGVRNLILHGEIVTTEAKAKEYKRLSDKLISKAMTDTVPVRRQLHEFFGKRDIVNTLIEQVVPALKGRQSGYSRISEHGYRRGDNTKMVKLELVAKPKNLGTFKKPVKAESKKANPVKKKVAPVKKTKKTVAKKTTKKVASKSSVRKTATKTSKKTK